MSLLSAHVAEHVQAQILKGEVVARMHRLGCGFVVRKHDKIAFKCPENKEQDAKFSYRAICCIDR